jgi:hypothetical protein
LLIDSPSRAKNRPDTSQTATAAHALTMDFKQQT